MEKENKVSLNSAGRQEQSVHIEKERRYKIDDFIPPLLLIDQ